MKLIHDCVRDVMLYIEGNMKLDSTLNIYGISDKLSKYPVDDLTYTCEKLTEAGYLDTHRQMDGNTIIERMTYDGHKFLDTIRDDGIWKETKSKISKLASVSIPIIQQVASQLISLKLGII